MRLAVNNGGLWWARCVSFVTLLSQKIFLSLKLLVYHFIKTKKVNFFMKLLVTSFRNFSQFFTQPPSAFPTKQFSFNLLSRHPKIISFKLLFLFVFIVFIIIININLSFIVIIHFLLWFSLVFVSWKWKIVFPHEARRLAGGSANGEPKMEKSMGTKKVFHSLLR